MMWQTRYNTIKDRLELLIKKAVAWFMRLSLSHKIVFVIISASVLWMLTGVAKKDSVHVNSLTGSAQVIYDYKHSIAAPTHRLLRLNGITEMDNIVDIKPENSGRVLEILAQEGDHLHKGDTILLLDPRNTRESLQQTKSELENAKIKYEAALALNKKGLGSRAGLTDALARLNAAQEAVHQAEIDLENTFIKAPFDGIVDRIDAKIGEVIDQFVSFPTLVKYVNTEVLYVIAYLAENQLGSIAKGDKAFVTIEGKNIIEGTVIAVSNIANAETKTFTIKVEIDNSVLQLASGRSVYVTIPIAEVMAHKIPLSAISIDDEGNAIVKYINNKTVHYANIEMVAEERDGLWISGLPEAVDIITLGVNNVQIGQEIFEHQHG